MKKLFSLFLLTLLPLMASAQPQTEDKVLDVVDHMPSYPGGMSALMQFLSSHVKYPKEAEENGISGRVVCTFVVERDGSIADVRIAMSVDPSLDKEAMRVIYSMPKWIPGTQNGDTVRVKYTLPLTFSLNGGLNRASKPTSKIVASSIDIDGIYYKLSETEATVISGKKKYIGDVIIPSSVMYEGATYSVTSIGEKAFESCYRLTSVTIPGSVKSIGYNAFHFCSALKKVSCYAEKVPSASKFAFDQSDKIALYVPEASMEAYKATVPWNKFIYIMKLSPKR
jgi:TonB family protein